MNTAEDLLSTARYLASRKWEPFYSHYFLGLIYVECQEVETMGVTAKLVLYYNSEWVCSLASAEVLATVLSHEVYHLDRKHIQRKGDREPRRWNISCDLSINHHLKEQGRPLPERGAYIEDLGFPPDKIPEEYYEMLEGDNPPEGLQDLLENGTVMAGACGGIAGNIEEIEIELNEKYGRTSADKKIIETQVKSDMEDYAKAHGQGSIPGHWAQRIQQEREAAKVPWRRLLPAIIKRATGRLISGRADYSLSRPSKRSYLVGIPRPGLIDHKYEAAVVLDTSGSMGTEELKESLRETAGILQQTGLDSLWFIQADQDVAAKPTQIQVRDLRDVEIHGRGGTSFIPALEAVNKLRPRPDIVLYFTDGWGEAPKQPPSNMEVVWCIVSTSDSKRPAPWGHLVRIE
jgi:predicted metal-dependent peptidase